MGRDGAEYPQGGVLPLQVFHREALDYARQEHRLARAQSSRVYPIATANGGVDSNLLSRLSLVNAEKKRGSYAFSLSGDSKTIVLKVGAAAYAEHPWGIKKKQ